MLNHEAEMLHKASGVRQVDHRTCGLPADGLDRIALGSDYP